MDSTSPPPSDSSDDPRAGVVEALRLLEQDPEAYPEAKKRLQGVLEHVEESDQEPHLTVEELKRLAEHPGPVQLPDHVYRCRLCMDLFLVLKSEHRATVPPPSPGRRAEKDSREQTEKTQTGKRRTRHLVRAAVLIGLMAVLRFTYSSPTLIIETGMLQQQGEPVSASTVPGRKELETLRETRLSLLDGSRITLAPGSTFRIGTRLDRTRYLRLTEGELEGGIAGASSKLHILFGSLQLLPGTSTYQLQVQEGRATVTVHQGAVDIQISDETVTLKTGETRTWDFQETPPSL